MLRFHSRGSSAATEHDQMPFQPSIQISHLEFGEKSTAMPNDLFSVQNRSAASSMIASSSNLDPILHTYGHASSQAVMSGNSSSFSNVGIRTSTVPIHPVDTSSPRHDSYPDNGPEEQLISASTYEYHSSISSTVDTSSLVPLAHESYLIVRISQAVSEPPSRSGTLESQDCMEYIEWDAMDEDRKSWKFKYPAQPK
ncbi:hypothetical protein ACEPAG_5455 [Sanghuangporus baumii]